jgi:hypothetical protein
VEPSPRGLCPTCGRFLPGNTNAVIHGLRSRQLAKIVDAYRVGLIEQLFAERGGKEQIDVAGRIAIENYALVCAQHKTIEARLDQDGLFTQTGRRRSAFDMLKAISETIDRLRAQLPPLPAPPMAPRIIEVRRVIVEPEADLTIEQAQERVNRAQKILDALRSKPAEGQPAEDLDPPRPTTHPDSGSLDTPSHANRAEAHEPTCPYCHQTPCVGRTHHAYEVLHHDDPEFVEQRRKREAAEMMENLRRHGPARY